MIDLTAGWRVTSLREIRFFCIHCFVIVLSSCHDYRNSRIVHIAVRLNAELVTSWILTSPQSHGVHLGTYLKAEITVVVTK